MTRSATRTTVRPISAAIATLTCAILCAGASAAGATPFIKSFTTTSTLSSTVPANGDQNPYGIVTVPSSTDKENRGDILVSNFNDQGPLGANGMPTGGGNQGEGTTIVEFDSSGGHPRLFAKINPKHFPGGVGLTTALAALPDGLVVVGSLPTTDGSSATMTAGALIVLNSRGKVVETISGGPINGPWDMTAEQQGPITTLFVSNVLNGTVSASPATVDRGTVVRLRLLDRGHRAPALLDERVIATGFPERTDPAALVVGPTGVGLGSDDTLYVADSVGDRIAKIPHASTRMGAVSGGGATLTDGSVVNHAGLLNDPLGLTIAPNGDILSTNGLDGNLLETTPGGRQVASIAIDTNNTNGAGDLFGLTVAGGGRGVLFVDDFDNTLRLLH